jgi:hypothetical protein
MNDPQTAKYSLKKECEDRERERYERKGSRVQGMRAGKSGTKGGWMRKKE